MIDIVHTRHGEQSEFLHAVFHLTNPKVAPWSSLMQPIQQRYSLEIVDFSVWLAELESIQNPTSADIMEKPALKLLSF